LDVFILVFVGLILLGLAGKLLDSTVGLGYGTFLAPMLLILGFPVYRVVPAILLSEFLSAGLTAVMHRAAGTVESHPDSRDFKVSGLLSLLGLVGAFAGVFLAAGTTPLFVVVYVSITVIVTGTLVVNGFAWTFSWPRLTMLGFVASMNKGLSGGGYGPLIAGGQILTGRETKKALATTAVAESVTTSVSWLLYWQLGIVSVNPATMLQLDIPLVIGAVISAPISVYLVRRSKPRLLIPIVGITGVLLGVVTLMKTLFGNEVAIAVTVLTFFFLLVSVASARYQRAMLKEEPITL
jgi:hypothetical protein